MAKTDLFIPSLGNKFIDLRDILPGDSYTWSWERDLSQINFLAIHSTNGLDTQTPEEIAQDHINKNGWGGIGYHFLISKTGEVFYVGDISTARANVANMNEQVLGIGIIGNFIDGKLPTEEQLDSCHELCEFLISLAQLSSVNTWDKVRGHKELPNQTTNCPGDDWQHWRIQIVEGLPANASVALQAGFESADQKVQLQSQVDSLQASLAAVNQQVISLQDVLAERDQEITDLRKQLSDAPTHRYTDSTLTIVGAFANLYKFVFPAQKGSN